MRNFIAAIIILTLIGIGIVMVLPGSPFLPGNDPEKARATAQADYLSRSEPLSGDEYVAVHGMDKIAEVARQGFDSNVQIAVSADASQTAMAQMICAAAWGPAILVLAICLLVFLLGRNNRKVQTEKERNDEG